jgi:hypothetical protein
MILKNEYITVLIEVFTLQVGYVQKIDTNDTQGSVTLKTLSTKPLVLGMVKEERYIREMKWIKRGGYVQQ